MKGNKQYNPPIFNVLAIIISKFHLNITINEISNNVVCATSKGSDQPAHTHSLIRASDQPAHTHSLIRAFASRLNILWSVKLLTEHHLEFLSLKGDCIGLSESTLVRMTHC